MTTTKHKQTLEQMLKKHPHLTQIVADHQNSIQLLSESLYQPKSQPTTIKERWNSLLALMCYQEDHTPTPEEYPRIKQKIDSMKGALGNLLESHGIDVEDYDMIPDCTSF